MNKKTATQKTIGIVGGGQLGRMLTQAAKKLGFRVIVLDPTPDSPAGQVADLQIVKDFKSAEGIRDIAAVSDFMTFEIESANAEALEELVSKGHMINPSPQTLSIIKDKFAQKQFLIQHDVPVADSRSVTGKADILRAIEDLSLPILLKAKRDAYDGRGNALVKTEADIEAAMKKLGDRELYVEKFVPFVKELAVVVARGMAGEIVAYPPVETIHKNNICHIVLSPAPIDPVILGKAQELAVRILSHLKGVGVFAIEMFVAADDSILVNEIAPRVHNSGHHTIEGHKTSQFEQHIRAITGMPLGKVEQLAPAAVMINILGERAGIAKIQGIENVLSIPGASIHVYGKLETRPERKMGHITIIDSDLDSALEKAEQARAYISI